MHKTVIFIATGAYSGYSPLAPGTAGTIAAIPIYLLLSRFSPYIYIAALLALLPVSFWSAGIAENIFGTKDSSQIVIDEMVGFLVAMFLAPSGWGYLVAGFLLFRFFDIAKVYPAGDMEVLGGGVGVVMDDVVAGIYANVSLQLLIFAGFFGLFNK